MLTVFQCITMEGWTDIMYWVRIAPFVKNMYAGYIHVSLIGESHGSFKRMSRHLRNCFIFLKIYSGSWLSFNTVSDIPTPDTSSYRQFDWLILLCI